MKLKITFVLIAALVIALGVWHFSYSPSCDGKDVSHYNTVNSSTKGINSINFMIAKATEGRNHVDAKYLRYKNNSPLKITI